MNPMLGQLARLQLNNLKFLQNVVSSQIADLKELSDPSSQFKLDLIRDALSKIEAIPQVENAMNNVVASYIGKCDTSECLKNAISAFEEKDYVKVYESFYDAIMEMSNHLNKFLSTIQDDLGEINLN